MVFTPSLPLSGESSPETPDATSNRDSQDSMLRAFLDDGIIAYSRAKVEQAMSPTEPISVQSDRDREDESLQSKFNDGLIRFIREIAENAMNNSTKSATKSSPDAPAEIQG